MSERILLKLGGSVITDKKADCAVNHEQLSLSRISHFPCPHRKVWSSFTGQVRAGTRKQNATMLDKGAMTGKTEGIFVTHRAVSRLNDAVVATLREQGVAAVGVHPLHAAVADNGQARCVRTPASGKDADARDGSCDPR